MKNRYVIGFDIYGTLFDPLQMSTHLQPLAGERADRVAALWREKQVEYAFRRGLMQRYENFEVCTHQALLFALQTFGIISSSNQREQLLEAYKALPMFADVLPGLHALRRQEHRVIAFSNGLESSVRRLLEHADIAGYFDAVVSVDALQTFKPNPTVYHYLVSVGGNTPDATWLVSSNPWDVIGAKSAGLLAAWVQRTPDKIFDPWDIAPDITVPHLEALAAYLEV